MVKGTYRVTKIEKSTSSLSLTHTTNKTLFVVHYTDKPEAQESSMFRNFQAHFFANDELEVYRRWQDYMATRKHTDE
jgi:hypothetical protein